MRVRAARTEDAQRCSEISEIRSADELRRLSPRHDVRWLVIENRDGIIEGTALVHLWAWNQIAWVWDLTIDERERGQGYGMALLKGIIAAARQMGGRVLMDFEPSRPSTLARLYVHSGFRICGTNDRWFASDKDSTAVFYGYDL